MDKENEVKTEKKKITLSKKQKDIIFAIASFSASFIVTTFIILTFAVFIPQGKINEQKKKYNSAISLLDNGNYEEAASCFKDLGYEDSRNLYHIAQAGQYFNNGDYESGIQRIHDAGGSINVNYDANGGNVTNNKEVLRIKKKWVEAKPTRNGYDFINWNVSSFVLSYRSKNYLADLNLLASWNIIDYSISYNLNGGSLNDLPNTYNVETPTFVLGKPTKKGYTFTGWSGTDVNGTSINVSIEKGSIGNRFYVANYEANQYTITYSYDYDSLSENQIVTYDDDFSLLEPSRAGYTFDGWYYNNQKVESGKWNIDSDVTLIARWSMNRYSITYYLYGGTNHPDNPYSFTYFDEFILKDPQRNGYTFDGWYLDDTRVEAIPSGTNEGIILQARWTPRLNILTVTSGDTNYGTVTIQSGTGYTDEEIVVAAEPCDGCSFVSWFDGAFIVSNEATYSFKMPAYDYSLTANFLNDEQVDLGVVPTLKHKTVTYGLYPQTHVNDSALIAELEVASTDLSTGWTLYKNEYYFKTESSYKEGYFDDGTKYDIGLSYWFKCEPIKWDVLSFDEHGAYVVSNEILDLGTFKGNQASSTIYKANYEESDIRTWLNNDFYNTAFSLNNTYIHTTEVDNSASTTDSNNNNNCCNNTFDNVYLGSYQDFYRMGPDSDRQCCLTDFARIRGYVNGNYELVDEKPINYYAYYLTRSPSSEDEKNYKFWYVDDFGALHTSYTTLSMGVRPCVYISLDNAIKM